MIIWTPAKRKGRASLTPWEMWQASGTAAKAAIPVELTGTLAAVPRYTGTIALVPRYTGTIAVVPRYSGTLIVD